MPIDRQLLLTLGVKAPVADRYLPDLLALVPQHQINSPLRIAHFLAQTLHESGLMRIVEENLSYSAPRLREVFPKYFTPAQANAYAGRPQAIGSRVYADRLGNGNEQSGDGYTYRGRGLIQLTGKANYRQFGQWIGDDVVANPALVATRYPVHCAVFFWATRGCNALADADDVVAVSKKINGGTNGLEDRVRLLDRAKQALLGHANPTGLEGATHRVRATQLNLRSEPRVALATRLATLPQGTPVVVLAAGAEAGWVRVRVLLGGQLTEGFVHGDYLEKATATAPKAMAKLAAVAEGSAVAIPPVHLKEGKKDVTRTRDGGRAHPLGEPGMPRRKASSPEDRVRQILEIVGYLDPEKKAHARYAPKTSTTFCNIYAYDFCYLAGAYLPRVFWTGPAIERLRQGEAVPVRYDETVRELSANSLYGWLADYGEAFGWRQTTSLDVLQAAANGGEVCLLVAKHRNVNESGHIVAIVPEHDGLAAARSSAGDVLRPVESQAGRKNHRLTVKPSAWWRDVRFQSFSFWRHQ